MVVLSPNATLLLVIVLFRHFPLHVDTEYVALGHVTFFIVVVVVAVLGDLLATE